MEERERKGNKKRERESKRGKREKESGTYSSGTDNECCIIDVSVDEVQARKMRERREG